MKKIIKRSRTQLGTPKTPEGITFKIPLAYTEFLADDVDAEPENFLLFDTRPDETASSDDASVGGVNEGAPSRMIAFGKESNSGWIAKAKVLLIDGTFASAPAPFKQMIVIMALRGEPRPGAAANTPRLGEHMVPVAHILMSSHRADDYQEAFGKLRDLWPAFKPDTVLCDLELGIHRAARNTFEGVRISTCFFHLAQAMYRVSALGAQCALTHPGALQVVQKNASLREAYKEDSKVHELCRAVTCLSYVREKDLRSSLELLKVSYNSRVLKLCQPVINWFEVGAG